MSTQTAARTPFWSGRRRAAKGTPAPGGSRRSNLKKRAPRVGRPSRLANPLLSRVGADLGSRRLAGRERCLGCGSLGTHRLLLLAGVVVGQPGAGGDQPANDDVFLQSPQLVLL